MDTNGFDRVAPLDRLDDFKVADGDPDVRGWGVIASDGRQVGEVDQLLVDTAAMKVRYLDVDLDDGMTAGADRHVLVPIGYARLDEGSSRVIVDTLAGADIAALPTYTHGPVTRDVETDLRSRFDAGYRAREGDDADFYAHDLYDDDRFFSGRSGERHIVRSEEELAIGRRRVEAGEVSVGKRVETEHVSRPVELSREEAVIERRPITDPGMRSDARIEDGEIRVPLSREEAVVEKRVVPKEELVVRKHEVQDTETVEADLRRERIDVDREGDTRIRGERR
ncbi:MAG: DUF2382 domain-containing protein [Gemmatimonadota bacterium]